MYSLSKSIVLQELESLIEAKDADIESIKFVLTQ